MSKGQKKMVEVVTSEPYLFINEKGRNELNIRQQKVSPSQRLKAPIKKGDEIGTVTIEKDGEKLVRKHHLSQKKMLNGAGWWTLYKRSIGMFTQIRENNQYPKSN